MKLKVYRTAIGFHDAYVAAPSQKAALKAWGSDADLFARGIAEAITDPALMDEPLSRPGEVIKRSRGTAAEQIAALGVNEPRARRHAVAPQKIERSQKPSRTALDDAEAALAQLESAQAREDRDLAQQEAELARRRRALEQQHHDAKDALEEKLRRARDDYDRALRDWHG